MSYPPSKIPDAPMPVSMMPRLDLPSETDLLYVVKTDALPGERSRAMELGKLMAMQKFESSWVTSENRGFQVDTTLAQMVVPKNFGGRFEFKLNITLNTSGPVTLGKVYEIFVGAWDHDNTSDVLFTNFQKIIHDSSGSISGSGSMQQIDITGYVDVPDTSLPDAPNNRTIDLLLSIPQDEVVWAARDIKIKGVLWKNVHSDNVTPVNT